MGEATQEIRFYGCSDDLVELDGALREEWGSYEKATAFKVTAPDGSGVRVSVEYCAPVCGDGATWAISLAPLDEDVPMVPARVILEPERQYSAAAVLDVPAGTVVWCERGPNGGGEWSEFVRPSAAGGAL